MPCSLLHVLLFLRNMLSLWWKQLVLPNHLYISVRWHCITCQATAVCIGTTMRTSNFTNFCGSHCLVDFRLLPLRWDLHSSGMLHSAEWISLHLKTGPISCPKTSLRNYHSTVSKIPEECKSHLPRGGGLKSRILHKFFFTFSYVGNKSHFIILFVPCT